MNKKLNVAVVFGGISPEHEVSIITGIQVFRALDRTKYNPLALYITKTGEWYKITEKNVDASKFIDLQSLLLESTKVAMTSDPTVKGVINLEPDKKIHIGKVQGDTVDIFFPTFHGNNGEDGAFQGLMKLSGATYVGCNVQSSSIGIDKIISKHISSQIDVPTLPYLWYTKNDWQERKDSILKDIIKEIEFPIYVKPSRLGSSIAVTRTENKKELENAIDVAFFYDSRVLIEKGLGEGFEINISIIGNDPYELSATEQPVKSTDFLSFEDKYIPSEGKSEGMASAKRIVPAKIKPKTQKKIEDYSRKFFREIDGKGLARIDYLVTKDEKEIFFNEINTLPGSIAYYLWEAKGLKTKALVTRLIELAISEKESRDNLNTTFKSNILQGFEKSQSAKF